MNYNKDEEMKEILKQLQESNTRTKKVMKELKETLKKYAEDDGIILDKGIYL